MQQQKERQPDSDFEFRLVLGHDGWRVTWHNLDCAIGINAKRSRRTKHATPEARRAFLEKKHKRTMYYNDHLAKCCIGKPTQEDAALPKFTKRQAQDLFSKAYSAGLEAGDAYTPRPMVVGTPTTPLGNDIDPSKRTYYVPDGVCGFAWIVIRPGNSSLARHAVRLGIGSKAYGGGVAIWIHDHRQSLERKQQHAHAYAKILSQAGVDAYAQSRID